VVEFDGLTSVLADDLEARNHNQTDLDVAFDYYAMYMNSDPVDRNQILVYGSGEPAIQRVLISFCLDKQNGWFARQLTPMNNQAFLDRLSKHPMFREKDIADRWFHYLGGLFRKPKHKKDGPMTQQVTASVLRGFLATSKKEADALIDDKTQQQQTESPLNMDTVYQISGPSGARKRYVRAMRVYGEKAKRGLVECEVLVDLDNPKAVGSRVNVGQECLVDPDQYPKYMFSPEIWRSKVAQSNTEKRKEIAGVITAYFQANNVVVSSLDPETARMTLTALKKLLGGVFGGFTLALFLNFIKKRINKEMEVRTEPNPSTKSMSEKIKDMNRTFGINRAKDALTFAQKKTDKKAEEK
jgi:hypothetical protein